MGNAEYMGVNLQTTWVTPKLQQKFWSRAKELLILIK